MEYVTDNGIATSVFAMALNAKDPNDQNLIKESNAEQLKLNDRQRSFRNLLYNHPAISYAFCIISTGSLPDSDLQQREFPNASV